MRKFMSESNDNDDDEIILKLGLCETLFSFLLGSFLTLLCNDNLNS